MSRIHSYSYRSHGGKITSSFSLPPPALISSGTAFGRSTSLLSRSRDPGLSPSVRSHHSTRQTATREYWKQTPSFEQLFLKKRYSLPSRKKTLASCTGERNRIIAGLSRQPLLMQSL